MSCYKSILLSLCQGWPTRAVQRAVGWIVRSRRVKLGSLGTEDLHGVHGQSIWLPAEETASENGSLGAEHAPRRWTVWQAISAPQFCAYMTGLHDWWSQWDNYSPNTCMTSRAAILVVVGHCGTCLLFTCHIKTPPYPNLTSNDLNRHPQRRYSIISVNAVCAKILQILNVDLTDLQRSLRVIRINVNW